MTTTLSLFIAVGILVLLGVTGLVFVVYTAMPIKPAPDPDQGSLDLGLAPPTGEERTAAQAGGGQLAGR